MQAEWLPNLEHGRLVLIDGGTGSELRRRGMPLDDKAWSARAALTHPRLLREVHADFIRAGARVITTNTFATTRFVLAAAGLETEFEALNRAAVAAAIEAREAVGDAGVAIAGSISCLPPLFDANAYPGPQRERAAYRELARLLADSGADLIALEMLEDTVHARLALDTALETGLPVWLGISSRKAADGAAVAYDFPGTPLAAVLDALVPLGPTVVNVMHTPPDAVSAALAEVRRRWRGPVGVYPELGDGEPALSPAQLVEAAAEWVGQGARLLGGCCGTTPAHIAALHEALPALAEHGPAAG